MSQETDRVVAVIGAGFAGLSAAYELGLRGIRTIVLERDGQVGGLAGSFEVGDGSRLERFYHHWFTSDAHVMDLVDELGLHDQVVVRDTRTGMYYANRFYRLSTPLDLLRFEALPLADRIRLGLMVVRVRRVADWRALESLSAAEWLRRLGGDRVFETVWEPLLRGKFGDHAEEVSAVWFWNKLKLRGGSRGSRGEERLAYYRGGFAALADAMAERIEQLGGRILLGSSVSELEQEGGRVRALVADGRRIPVSAVLATAALPEVAELLRPHVPADRVAAFERIRYLANLCLVLELDRSLSSTYWLNVSDPSFPFVGVIEHTNFEPPATYGGRHVVYLSKYLPADADLYRLDDDEVARYCLEHLGRMFPELDEGWVVDRHVWRARYAQPIVERGYGSLIDDLHVPLAGFHLATMAQVYPEDRGTNYAIGQGRAAARAIAESLSTG